MNHADLCRIAVRWLRYPGSRGGPGCVVALSEPRIGYLNGEIPDAIGFRTVEPDAGSTVIECKASRADFRADCKKAHRSERGMGVFRYFMAPEGLLAPEEIPDRWGLLTVSKRGAVRAVRGLLADRRAYLEAGITLASSPAMLATFRELCPDREYILDSEVASRWTWTNDSQREVQLLTMTLSRVGDVEAANQRIREAEGKYTRLARQYEAQREELRLLRAEHAIQSFQIRGRHGPK